MDLVPESMPILRTRFWALGAALLLVSLPTWAGYHQAECLEFVVPGHAAPLNCPTEFGLSNLGGPAPAAVSLRVNSYGSRDGMAGSLYLRFDTVDAAEGGDWVLPITALYQSRSLLNAAQTEAVQTGASQGPARGQCRVSGLESAQTTLRCEVKGSAGDVILSLRLRQPATLFVRDLRQTRFDLAQAAQARKLPGPWPVIDQQLRAVQVPDLDERSCNTETQAQRAEELAKGGKADAVRLAAVCWGRAAQYSTNRVGLWAKARDWFERAMAQGDAEATYQYALLSQEVRSRGGVDAKGNDVRPSPAELAQINADSMALYLRAAERGLHAAQATLCSRYAFGGMPDVDPSRAVPWCQKAIDAGNGHAAWTLSAMHAQGRGVPRDLPKSYQLALKAAEMGDGGALMNLGRAYENGTQDSPFGQLPRDLRKAADAYRRARMEDKAAQLEAAMSQVGSGVDTSVFGLAVGFAVPGNIGQCGMQGNDPSATMCFDREVGEFARMMDRIGLSRIGADELGVRLRVVQLDSTKLETGFLLHVLGKPMPLELLSDTKGTLQYLTMSTQITQGDAVLRMLTSKYGRPTRTEFTEWRDPRNGQVLRKTPVTFWELKGLTAEFHAQDAYTLTNAEAPRGRINVYSTLFGGTLQRLRAQQVQSAPKKGF